MTSNCENKRHDPDTHEATKSGKKRKKTGSSNLVPADLNSCYEEKSFKDNLGAAFRGRAAFEHESGAKLHNDPFSCCVLPNFVKDTNFLQGLKDDLLGLPFKEKSNDLYKFQQSGALQNYSSPHIIGLRKFLYEDFLCWLREVTGITLNDTVDMTCSKYNYTDALLCHDDELGGRRIAFIFYLLPSWTEQDGGSLDLFNVDEHGQPSQVVKSLFPKWNNFVFFEVNPVSFHQVAEVLCEDKCRLSVSGWFHGSQIDRPTPYIEPKPELHPHITIEDDEIYHWVNPLYLDVLNQSEIQDRFTNDSEIELENFLSEAKYEMICEALESSDISWERRGPANKRNYERADRSTLPEVVQQCLKVLQSEHMFLTMSNFTGLKLHESAPDNDSDDDDDKEEEREGEEEAEAGKEGSDKKEEEKDEKAEEESQEQEEDTGNSKPKPVCNPRCRAEVRRWSHGCYTLMHDTDTEGSEFALDAVIQFNCPIGWQMDHGGYITYIAKAEDDELLSICPESNALSLVYRDKETLRFVKHVNHRFIQMDTGEKDSVVYMYDIRLVYYE
ncbi:prolyl 3-hydroxylase OGFOD1-like [Asterias rubens]|uniref:prolyl 3-hydroxylase OGFOD1-like n=1 Tax=Asterias rubens TaxID=7604 RepID=UPI0014551938|nr:prolyl 3-hydroxylase OGFOD1-like [Asterias rubens]